MLAPFALRPAFPVPVAGRYARDYYGASVPPDTISGRRACPFPRWLRETRATSGGSHVHHMSIGGVGAQLCPCSIANGYAVVIHRGLLPVTVNPGPEFLPGSLRAVRTATQPISTRFELVGRLRGFTHWFLTYAFPPC